MAYIPKSKVTLKETQGAQLETKDKEVYVGKYYVTSDGKMFAGENTWNQDTPLFPINDIISGLFGHTETTKNYVKANEAFSEKFKGKIRIPEYKSKPTEDDYKRGYYTRTFLVRVNSFEYKEIDPINYQNASDQKKVDKDLYKTDSIKWALKGDVYNINKNQIQLLEREYPGIINLFPIFTEHQEIINYNITNRKYIDGEIIDSKLPPSYDLPKINQACKTCAFYEMKTWDGKTKAINCSKWEANVRSNYWCASFVAGHIPTDNKNNLEDEFSHYLKKENCTQSCNELTRYARFSEGAKQTYIQNCIDECVKRPEGLPNY